LKQEREIKHEELKSAGDWTGGDVKSGLDAAADKMNSAIDQATLRFEQQLFRKWKLLMPAQVDGFGNSAVRIDRDISQCRAVVSCVSAVFANHNRGFGYQCKKAM
jgi:hypothetical protein